MLAFLNIFFIVFHTLFLLFNVFGWIWKKTRKWNLVCLLLTAFSWFVIGFWHGWGYCICTDWHWQVREQMGILDRSDSYTHFLLYQLTGINADQILINNLTAIAFFACFFLSIVFNLRDFFVYRKKNKTT
jgi:hypothetical protein